MCYRNAPDNVLPKPAYAPENSNAQITDASIIDRTDVNRNPQSEIYIQLQTQAELTPMKPIASQTEPGVIVDLITPDKPANRIPITSMTPSKELGTLMNRTLSFESGNYF